MDAPDPILLRAGNFTFTFPGPTLVMGVLNVTPDSFSDGGRFFSVENAVEQGWKLVGEGADIIDIGGESTRPGAGFVSEDEEIRRVIPVIERLRNEFVDRGIDEGSRRCMISIDTYKPGVARRALKAGASMVNDVGVMGDRSEVWKIAAEFGAACVLMHSRGSPETMQSRAVYDDVVEDVERFMSDQLPFMELAGLKQGQIVIDPGIGFGKKAVHNLELLRGLRKLTKWRFPILVGASRKKFMGEVGGADGKDRLSGSIACASWAVEHGASIVRVHDVRETRLALRMTEAIMGTR